jgi:hypothetical protein
MTDFNTEISVDWDELAKEITAQCGDIQEFIKKLVDYSTNDDYYESFLATLIEYLTE